MEITKIHINYPGQHAALAALRDEDYLQRSTDLLRRNIAHLRETVDRIDGITMPVQPQYGFCTVLDVAESGATAQELTVSLLARGIAVIPGDGLGDVGADRYIRLNYSSPDINAFEQRRAALPDAIAEAASGRWADQVDDFFARADTARGNTIRTSLAQRTSNNGNAQTNDPDVEEHAIYPA